MSNIKVGHKYGQFRYFPEDEGVREGTIEWKHFSTGNAYIFDLNKISNMQVSLLRQSNGSLKIEYKQKQPFIFGGSKLVQILFRQIKAGDQSLMVD